MKPCSIVLADDHVLVRSGVRALLESAGARVVGEVADAPSLIAMVTALVPDIAFVDVALGATSGIEAVRAMRAADPRTRAVMLSMHAEPQYIYESLAAGADGYVLKDAAFQDLLSAVDTVLAGGRYLSAGAQALAVDDYATRAQSGPPRSALDALTPREREVLTLVAEGESSGGIGRALFISPRTVETHRKKLMQKLGVHSVAGLTRFAIRHGLCVIDP